MNNPLELTLYTRPECSLCDRLEELIAPHLESLRRSRPVTLTKRDITDDPQTEQLYKTRIPVLTCSQRILLEGRPTPEQAAQAIASLAQ